MPRAAEWKLHNVAYGDTLSELARTYKTTVGELVAANGIANPELISVGQILKVYAQYPVQDGDTLSWIARDFRTTVDTLLDLNPQYRADPDTIYVGQLIRIPTAGAVSSASSGGSHAAGDTWPAGQEANAADEPVVEPLITRVVNDIAPPTYENDIVPVHRRTTGPFFLQIGDVQTVIPPSFISVRRTSGVRKVQGVRQKNSIKTKAGYSTTEVRMTLFFHDLEQINGAPVPSPFGDSPYYMDGLRPLLAQFMRTPILPVINEHLNIVHNIWNVVLSSITVQTVDGFPGLLQCQLVLHKTTTAPYTMRTDEHLAEMFNWPVFRAYTQKALVDQIDPNATRTQLRKIASPAEMGEFTFMHLDEEFLQVVEEAKDEDGKPLGFDKVVSPPMTVVPTPDLHLQTLAVSLGNAFAPLQTQMSDSPSHQYLGSMDTTIIMEFVTDNASTVAAIRGLYEAAGRIAINHHDRFVSGYIQLLNPLIQLFGTRACMFEALHTETVEGHPGLHRILLSLVSFDHSQRRTEALSGLSHLEMKDGTSARELEKHLESMKTGDHNYIDHAILAERCLNRMELYPDLELPTYDELTRWVTAIEAQRRSFGLKPTGYKVPKASGASATGALYVDPDFYMMYAGWRPAGMLDTDMLGQGWDKFLAGETSSGTDSEKVSVPSDLFQAQRVPEAFESGGSSGEGAQGTAESLDRFQVTSYLHFPLDSQYTATPHQVKEWLNVGLRYSHNATSVLRGTEDAWIEAQAVSGVNILFLMALAMNESAWGTSEIAHEKFNFFGMTAYNHAPKETAQDWRNLGVKEAIVEGARWVAKFFVFNGKSTIYKIQHQGAAYAQLDNGMPNPEWEATILSLMQTWVPLGEMIRAASGSGPMLLLDQVGGFASRSGGGAYGAPGRLTDINFGDSRQLPVDFLQNAAPQIAPVPEDDRTIAPYSTIPKDSDKLLAQMCQDQMRYNMRGRMLRAFPTYVFLFVDEGLWADGRRLWTNYYAYSSLLSLSVVREAENPVDVAHVEVTNIYGDLSRKSGIPEEAIPDTWLERLGQMWRTLNPQITEKMVESRKRMADSAAIKAGARVHIRLGYGSVASELPIAFNGHIGEIGVSDTIAMVCQGDGVELIQVMTEFTNTDATGGVMPSPLSTFGHEAQDIIRGIMTERSTGFRWFNWAGEDSPYGIAHFGVVQKGKGDLDFVTKSSIVAASAGGGALVAGPAGAAAGAVVSTAAVNGDALARIVPSLLIGGVAGFFVGGPLGAAAGAVGMDLLLQKIGFGWYWATEWDVVKNIHSSNPEHYLEDKSKLAAFKQWMGEHSWWDGEKNIKLYLGGRSPWDIFNTVARATPDYRVAVHPFQFRSTLFFGLPHMSLRYGYVRRKSGPSSERANFGEMVKPFTQFHVLTSYTDLLGNEVRASGDRLVTNAAAIYNENGKPRQAPVQKADASIKPENQRTAVIDSGLLQNAYFPIPWDDELLRNSGLYKNGQDHAIQVARSHIQSSFKQMYQGELVIFGSPEMKPQDLFYLNDTYTKMFGTAEVGQIVHTLGPDTGFISTIRPNLVVSRTKGPWSEMLAGLTARGIALTGSILKAWIAWRHFAAMKQPWHRLMINGVRSGYSMGIKAFQFASKTWRVAKGFTAAARAEGLASALTWWKRVKTVGRVVGAGGSIWSFGATWIMWEIAVWTVERMVSAFLEWLEGQNVIHIFPLWYKDRPYVAGIDGWKDLIPGLPDPTYYPNSLPPHTRKALGMQPAPARLEAKKRLDMGAIGTKEEREKAYAVAKGAYDKYTQQKGGHEQPSGQGVYLPKNTTGWTLPLPRGAFRVTTFFGPDRLEDGTERFHQGWDLGAGEGTQIMAMKEGTVVVAQEQYTERRGYGKFVVIRHGENLFSIYAHLSGIAVARGQTVKTGEVIGAVGNTGFSFGPHLHVEIRHGGQTGEPVDPAHYFPDLI